VAQPADLLYSREHEWVRIEGNSATVGITDYAQSSLGDIVYVELPKVGTQVAQFSNTGVIESVKAVSDLYTPLSGEVIAINDALENDPALVNREAFGGGWLFKLQVKDPKESENLVSPDSYAELAQAQ